ncbi:hypothetical protein [Micromonospora echinofusca]|uniref:Copper(I)-binding protein n=1 Tax=Micromonospora echinofusca TaxID=47858 RepID=A0ABS3W0E1_MICEH|nr:hypothetical protein [Micromonospora echinofusca]MBO4210063.1 hypothetical protein [Micromonospora echinofusca]
MTRSIRGSRRAAVLLAGLATATSLLVAGCGSGQVAETAAKEPSIGGVNVQTPDNAFKIRNANVAYPSTEGYPAGGTAPLTLALYNDSPRAVTVTVTSDSARTVSLGGAAAPAATASATASATPETTGSPSATAGATPSAPGTESPAATPTPEATPAAPAAPATIELPAGGYVLLNPEAGSFLQLVGLNQALRPGQAVNVTFDFGQGVTLATSIPVAVPLTPVPPASPVIGEGAAEEQHG